MLQGWTQNTRPKPTMGRNTSYFGSWGTDTPKRSKSLSHIITWLIPVGESEQEFQKATKTLHPLLPLKKREVTL